MESTSFTADKALAEALTRLAAVEEDNASLKIKLQQLALDARRMDSGRGGGGGGGACFEGQREVEKLKKQNQELIHVNHQWDLEYKELDEAFQKYRMDSKQAQGESHALIARLKDSKESLSTEVRDLQAVISRKDKEIGELRTKARSLEEEVRVCRFGKTVVNRERVRELEEESQMLRQQLKAYHEDFNAERRDREKMNEKRESAAIRYEAEVTSLRLQLERCRNELAHYTAEANRLSQQLRLKSQIEEEQYKRHLESNGYITRSASGHLPPLDPFVDHDEESKKIVAPPTSSSSSRLPPRAVSPRLLTRGVDLVQAYSNSTQGLHHSQQQQQPFVGGLSQQQGAPSSASEEEVVGVDSDRSRSPIMMNGTGHQYYHTSNNSSSNGLPNRRSVSPSPLPPSTTPSNSNNSGNDRVSVLPASDRYSSNSSNNSSNNSAFRPNIPPSMVSSKQQPQQQQQQQHNGYSNGVSPVRRNNSGTNLAHNGTSHAHNGTSHAHKNGVAASYHIIEPADAPKVYVPPLQTTGKYSCPRCERKFESKKIWSDHKTRCIV